MNDEILKVCLESLFDHAGTFPPAAKEFDQALKDAGSFSRTLRRPYLVATDFVTEVSNLGRIVTANLQNYGFSAGAECRVCVLGSTLGAATTNHNLSAEIEAIKAFYAVGSDSVRRMAYAYECKIENQLLSDQDALLTLINDLSNQFPCPKFTVALEPNLATAAWQSDLRLAVEILAAVKPTQNRARVALKLRGNGPQAITNEIFAEALMQAVPLRLPLKATGGLHHPLIETERYQNSFGFLNLTLALIVCGLDRQVSKMELLQILENTDPGFFDFTTTLKVGSKVFDLEAVKNFRRNYSFTIGSCSLVEPDSDLTRLYY
ncbi:hypothetical protein JNK13_06495 [bacterium]|nr:hypothetical protein [bacterium]